ncbi:hypothetical protein [Streptomyces sp. NPDC048188]|uniref:hypothetical protein n=1 Tax=Streptomyces sp. NPDC048188 TaxID=3155749 RepID=UPI00343B3C69
MSAFDDIRRALTDAYGTGMIFDDLTASDLIKAAVAETYPGELAMLRGLVRVLRTVVREDGSLEEARRLLWQHASDESAAYSQAREKSSPAGVDATPADTTRRAQLLYAMSTQGGRWKSGRVTRWYEANGYEGLTVRDARRDLAVLRDRGHIHQHDSAGVRFFTTSLNGDSRG